MTEKSKSYKKSNIYKEDMNFISKLFKIIFIHAAFDGTQSPYIAKYKSPLAIHPSGDIVWPTALGCHALFNGCGIWLLTGSVSLGLYETMCHFMIDYGSSMGWYCHYTDQALHITSKISIVLLWNTRQKSSIILKLESRSQASPRQKQYSSIFGTSLILYTCFAALAFYGYHIIYSAYICYR